MDIIKLITGLSNQSDCDHTKSKLQRRLPLKPEFKVSMPGIGTAISIKRGQPDYVYHCLACGKDLPISNNSRWEGLFNSYRPPVPVSRKSVPTRQNVKQSYSKSQGVKSGNFKREPIGSKLRYDILTRDGYRCVKCGARGNESKLHVDHKKPVSHGGTNDPSNLQTLCENCNLGKGARIG